MCGIAGFINVQEDEDGAEKLLHRMCQVIRHRGPDSQGTWVEKASKGDDNRHRVALGMRRLSIIDLAGGDQPIFNEDASVLVVFNGEIYN
jgi:asparagine synthase (glutamine-hydrolysing)